MQAELKSKDIYTQSDMIWIDTEKIMPNRSQPRTVFDAEALNELAESIKKYGILQPLSVRSNPEKSEFSSFHLVLRR
jgi:ParB family chromosome partitioning protein